MISQNLHTHSSLCDGKNTLEEMVQGAINCGMTSLGFSGHSYTAYDECYCMSKENTIFYKKEIAGLKEKYKGKIEIFCGIEQDFGSDESTDGYDYVIGSVHAFFPTSDKKSAKDYFRGYDRSKYYYVDWTIDRIENAVADDFGGDPYAFIEGYYDAVSQVYQATACDIIGHFDLITKFNEKHPWFDESNPRYVTAAKKALAVLLKSGAIFEVNTGAISRGWRTKPYPSVWILKEICLQGGSVILSSDSHDAGTIDCKFNEALDTVKNCGFKTVKRLTAKGFIDIEI